MPLPFPGLFPSSSGSLLDKLPSGKCVQETMAAAALSALMPHNLAARLKAITVLGSSGVKGISFKIPGAEVTSAKLSDVRKHIMTWRIQVIIWNQYSPNFNSGAIASYDPDSDTLAISSGTDRFSTSSIVHEAVHAAHDAANEKAMTVLTTEASAYIAECLFQFKIQTVEHRTLIYDRNSQEDDIYKEAWAIAERILARGNQSGNKPQSTFTEADLRLLYDAIKAAYSDSGNSAGNNGIRTACK